MIRAVLLALLVPAGAASAGDRPPPPRPAGQAPAAAPQDPGPVCALGGLLGRPEAPRSEQGGCRLADAVTLESIGGVTLSPAPVVTCETARTLAQWLETVARPALSGPGRGLAGLDVAAGYVCRTRNNQPGAKISEHALGRAVDVMALRRTDGSVLRIGGATGPDAALVARLRAGACGPFTTVLGPGSDAFHEDHLHFDIAERRRTYCH